MNLKKQFSFDDINDFDRHIALSIPNYDGLCNIFEALTVENVNPFGTFVDCGCSTGRFVSNLPKNETSTYVGSDIIDIRKYHDFEFIQGDSVELLKSMNCVDVVCVMFTLQFLGKHKRAEMIGELKRLADGGAKILIAEKVLIGDVKVNQVLHREHIRQKRQSFSDNEILKKDYELMGSMFCLSGSEIANELSVFNNVEQVWQSYNFKAWCVW